MTAPQDLGGVAARELSMGGQSSIKSQDLLRSDGSFTDEETLSLSRKFTGSFSWKAIKSLREQSATEADKGINPYHQIKRVLNPRGPLFQQWNVAFLLSTVLGVSLDPLFFYIPAINDPKKCIFFDTKLAVTAITLRSAFDCFHLIYIGSRLHTDFFTPLRGHSGSSNHWKIARKYLCSRSSLVDILSVLPLPQVILFIIMPRTRGSRFFRNTFLLNAVSFQLVPRIIRIYVVFRRERKNFIGMVHAASAKAAYNLLLYMLASHLLGALWYFYGIVRVVDCWQTTMRNHTSSEESFLCKDSNADRQALNMSCSVKSPRRTFQFGMFLDVVESGIMQATFLEKFFHCFRWGIQNLSCFGQNIKTNSDIWENFFAASISIAGLCLFVFLIGNMQTYLQTKTVRSEEMRLKTQEIEQWKSFSKLPKKIQLQVKKYQRFKWQETRGVDVEQLLEKLPFDMRRQIKCKLGFELLKKVPEFDLMGDRVVESLCCRLKPVLFVKRNYIFREADPVDEMLFIVQGRLCIYQSVRSISSHSAAETSSHIRNNRLESGDFCGEELLQWIRDPHSLRLPISDRTIQAKTKVEAFALLADDLKLVYTQNQWRLHKEMRMRNRSYGAPGYSAEYWFCWAARTVQSAWRKRKMARGRLAAASCNYSGRWVITV